MLREFYLDKAIILKSNKPWDICTHIQAKWMTTIAEWKGRGNSSILLESSFNFSFIIDIKL